MAVKRRLAQLPLHTGKAPSWLFKRMARLAGAVTMAIVDEFGPDEMLRRLSDPWWFQAFGCVLGFDWHSSGVTTVTCGALREAGSQLGDDLGILVAGGKGGTSRRTPGEITNAADRIGIEGGARLVHASRLSAKVDSAAVQDGFTLYHHSFFFTPQGSWCVVQQGMNEKSRAARRYHWLGDSVDDFVCEPHTAIEDLGREHREQCVLNMVAAAAAGNREAGMRIVCEHPDRMMDEIRAITDGPTLFAPQRHRVLDQDINAKRLRSIITAAYEQQPHDYEALLGMRDVGPAAVRGLALLAEIIFDAPVSRADPVDRIRETGANARRWADYSCAHGGKDGTPFPVDRETYDRNIAVLIDAIRNARLGENDKFQALRRLTRRSP